MKDKLVISYDIAGENSKDYSAVSTLCGNCRTILFCKTFEGEELELELHSSCPNCETIFNEFIELGI